MPNLHPNPTRTLTRALALALTLTPTLTLTHHPNSNQARIGLVDAWARSSNIDYLSPQLYTTGGEGAEFAASTGQLGDVGYEHYVGAKAKFVPSIVHEDQVDPIPLTPHP